MSLVAKGQNRHNGITRLYQAYFKKRWSFCKNNTLDNQFNYEHTYMLDRFCMYCVCVQFKSDKFVSLAYYFMCFGGKFFTFHVQSSYFSNHISFLTLSFDPFFHNLQSKSRSRGTHVNNRYR